MLLVGTVGVACQTIKDKSRSAADTVEEKAEVVADKADEKIASAKETLDSREDTVTNVEPASGAITQRVDGQAEDMRIEPDVMTPEGAAATADTAVTTDEDVADADIDADADVDGDEGMDTGVAAETDIDAETDMDADVDVTPAPVVVTDGSCDREILAKSPGAVGNPCMTTVAFVDTLNLDDDVRTDALDGVEDAGGDVRVSH
jgi:hypothetical protein